MQQEERESRLAIPDNLPLPAPDEADEAEEGGEEADPEEDAVEEDGGDAGDVAQVPERFHPLDANRMELTQEEREWALQIKERIESSPDLEPLSDFRYAQLAIIERDNIDAALQRAFHMQSFRQEDDILDTPGDSRRCLSRLIQLFQTMFLSYSFNADDGNYYLVYDITQFTVKDLTTTRHYSSWHSGCYYLCHAMSVDFELIRRGVMVLCECQGYDWTQHIDIKTFQRDWLELAMHYPLHFQSMTNYHAGVLFNMFVAMLKHVAPKRLADAFGRESQQLDARLDTIYLVPTVDIANQRLLGRLDQILKRRYNLEESFQLVPPSEGPSYNE